jgi:Zn-dependent protease
MTWWVAEVWTGLGSPALAAWVFWVIASITLHELGHGVAAIWRGDRTPVETGHMTWNPVVHMGTSGVIMFALLGVTWGFMPVNPSRFRGRYDDAKVSLAGPVTNLWLALFGVAGGAALISLTSRGVIDVTIPGSWPANLLEFFFLGAKLNFVLFALNLLPVPPLDGSRILASFSRRYRDLIESPQASGASLVILLMLFFFGGRFLFPAADDAAVFLMTRLAGLVS